MKMLTIKDAASVAGVSATLLYQWCQEKRLPHYRCGGDGRRGKILIKDAELWAFLDECRVERHALLDPLPAARRS